MRINDPSGLENATSFDGWTVDESGLLLSIWFWETTVYGMLRLFTSEDDRRVNVLALDSAKPLPGEEPPFFDGAAYAPRSWSATLSRPLGARSVIDAATNRPVRPQDPWERLRK